MATAAKSKAKAVPAAANEPGWQEDALGFLIAPVAPADFLARVYEREALINIRNEPRRYADLLTLESLDHFIASTDLREGMISLVNRKNRINTEAYVDENGKVNRISVTEHYLRRRDHRPAAAARFDVQPRRVRPFAGGGLLLPRPDQHLSHARARSDGEANQGFPPHYDNHDVFVMQISGSKAWRIYGTPVDTPFRGETFELGRHEAGEATQNFTLSAGDCVYIPRGLMHDAENSGDEPSLHITVGLITKTWADLLLESISELAIAEPEFRRSLPAGFANRDFDREVAQAHFDKLIDIIADDASMDGAFDLIADNFVRAPPAQRLGRDRRLARAGAGKRPLPPPPLRPLERRRRRGQAGADRPRRRPDLRSGGGRRPRRRLCPARPSPWPTSNARTRRLCCRSSGRRAIWSGCRADRIFVRNGSGGGT